MLRGTIAARGRSFSPAMNKILDEIEGPQVGRWADLTTRRKAYERKKARQDRNRAVLLQTYVDSARAKKELSEDLFKRRGAIRLRIRPSVAPHTIGQFRGNSRDYVKPPTLRASVKLNAAAYSMRLSRSSMS